MARYYYLNDPEPAWKKGLIILIGLIGLGGLGFSGYFGIQMWSEVQQAQAYEKPKPEESLAAQMAKSESQPEPEPDLADEGTSTVWEERPSTGKKVGTLIIPRIDAEIPIWEGTGDRELSKGVGHHQTSVLPGEGDNCVLAGHRETAFRRAKEIQKGDEMAIKTREGTFMYEVRKTWVADEKDKTVISSVGEPVLRVYTCWPLSALYSGYAPKRYVMEAELVEVKK